MPQHSLDTLAGDPKKLAELGFVSLATVSDPEVRKNRLYQTLLEIQEGAKRPDASDVDRQEAQFASEILAHSSGTSAPARFAQGAFRGLVEGFATPVAAEAFKVDRGLNSGDIFDANNIGNVVGNVAGFVAGPGKILKLGSVLKSALGLGALGAGQAVGSHQMFERDKQGAREELGAQGQEIPEALKPGGFSSAPATANIVGQAGLSALSGGLSGKLQALMQAGKRIPTALKAGAVASPVVEGVGSGALMLNDAAGGRPQDMPGEALAVALGAPLAMGGAQSAMTGKAMARYQPRGAQPQQGFPTPAQPKVGKAPTALVQTPTGAPGPMNFPPIDVADPDTVRATLGQSLSRELPARLNALQEIVRGGGPKNPAAEFFYSGGGATPMDAKLLGVLPAEDTAEQGLNAFGVPRYLLSEQSKGLLGLQEGALRDASKGYQLGAQLPGGERYNAPAAAYEPVMGETPVKFVDPRTGAPTDGIALMKPTAPDASGEMYWYVGVPQPNGTWKAEQVHASILQFPQSRTQPGRGPLKMSPPAPPLPVQSFGVDAPTQQNALDEILNLLRLTRGQQGSAPPANQLRLPFQ